MKLMHNSYEGNGLLSNKAVSSFHIYPPELRRRRIYEWALRFDKVMPPSFYFATEPGAFEIFKQYIGQHIDPFTCKELSITNRWAISALMYIDSRYHNLVRTQLDSFSTPACLRGTPTAGLGPLEEFDYLRTVGEILNAHRADRIAFMLWASVIGTADMMKVLLTAGIDPNEANGTCDSYLGLAAFARNYDTFEVLLDAGATVNDESAFLNFVEFGKESEDDPRFIKGLLRSTSPRDFNARSGIISPAEPWSYLLSYFLVYLRNKRYPPLYRRPMIPTSLKVAHELIASGFGGYSHPPYHSSLFLGPDVLYAIGCRHLTFLKYLINREASLDYIGCGIIMKGFTALQFALELGYFDAVKILLNSSTGFVDRVSALRRALANAESNIFSAHPRRVLAFDTSFYDVIAFHDSIRGTSLSVSVTKYVDKHRLQLCDIERFWRGYHQNYLGPSYEHDLRCYHLIREALEDMGVEVIDAESEDVNRRSYQGKHLELHPTSNRMLAHPAYRMDFHDMALHPLDVLRRQSVHVFARRLVPWRRWLRYRLHKITRMTNVDYFLLAWGIMEVFRALVFYLVWDIGVWLFKIPRPPRAVGCSLIVLLVAAFSMFWIRG